MTTTFFNNEIHFNNTCYLTQRRHRVIPSAHSQGRSYYWAILYSFPHPKNLGCAFTLRSRLHPDPLHFERSVASWWLQPWTSQAYKLAGGAGNSGNTRHRRKTFDGGVSDLQNSQHGKLYKTEDLIGKDFKTPKRF